MLKNTLAILLFFGLIFSSGSTTAQFYQGSVQEFGKSRVQYNNFGWKYHNYKRFRIYYSGINEDISVYVARTLHYHLNRAESLLDYSFPEKLEVIVYQSQSKFRQSNLGVTNDEQSNVGGTTRIVGSKIFMYFEGDHQSFNRNIKGAVYEVLLKHMFFGGDWKDQLKSTVNSGIPEWLEKGLIAYFVRGWDADAEGTVKDLILTKKIDKFNDLTPEEKIYAGHAVWNYVAETHGKTIIPNIIYITRVTKNVERGFFSLLGMDFTKLSNSYISFYRSRYIDEYKHQKEPEGEKVDIKNKRESVYYSAKLSPDGEKIAYVENQLGRYRIKIRDIATGKVKKIYAAEPKMMRIQDYSYPVLDWHPSGEALCFFAERRGELLQYIYVFEDKSLTEKSMKGLDKVLSFSYSPDGKQMILSAVVKGQSDLYLINLNSNSRTRITDDIWDDLQPQFVDNGSRVIFASNRDKDTIFKAPDIDFIDRKNDLFIYDLKQVKRTYKYLERITDTEDENELMPYQLEKGKYLYLSDRNGLYNRFVAERDSFISFIDTITHYDYRVESHAQTNYVTNILEHQVGQTGELLYTVHQNGKYKFRLDKASDSQIDVLWNTTYKERQLDRRNKRKKRDKKTKTVADTLKVGDMKYQKLVVNIGEDNQLKNPTKDTSRKDSSIVKKDKFSPPKYLIYKINFAKDYMLSQFDNNFLFPNYQPYSGPGSVYFNPGMNLLLKVGASDLFDDFKLLGGVRVPTSFNSGGEFLFMIQNLKKRLDHRLVVYRQKTVSTVGLYKWLTHDVRYRMSFPINEVWSLRGTANVRRDRQIYIPFSDNTLIREDVLQHNSGLNLELVLDNTIPMELNIRRGTRFKIFAEWLQQLGGNYDPTFNFGLDYRLYTRIKRNFIWVNRFATATSIGGRRLLYYMGGVDNWLLRSNPDFDSEITVDPSQNFAFQTIATPMRGFIQNARNGNSFAVFNTEFRLPVFTFFSTYPIKSEIIRHFQLVAFGDVGTAWTGPHPFSEENFFNTQVIDDKPVTINVSNLREPIIGGFGGGLRSKIWGYFVRLDFAWGIEDLQIQKPITYLSLTKDI